MNTHTTGTTDAAGTPLPETDLPQKPFTIEHIIERNYLHEPNSMAEIEKEFKMGFDFIKNYPKSVSIYGSARFKEDSEHYQAARHLAGRIVKELGIAIVTGGSGGIMEAANRGALEAGGDSIGLNIQLPHEQVTNKYLSASLSFYYFFVRKAMLSFAAEAYIFFPGGFGTLDEFFELTTLSQTNKIPRIPLILVGNDYWPPILETIKKNLLEDHKTIDAADLNLFTVTENEDEILELIRKAPMRKQ